MITKQRYGRVFGWVTDQNGKTFNCYNKGVLEYVEYLENKIQELERRKNDIPTKRDIHADTVVHKTV